MPIDQPSFIKKQQELNPAKIDLKTKLLQFLVTKLGLVVSGATSAAVTALLAWMAAHFGVDFTENPEITGALLLFINQTIWGGILWLVNRYELPYKKQLQEILGGGIVIDGLIGAQTVKQARIVRDTK